MARPGYLDNKKYIEGEKARRSGGANGDLRESSASRSNQDCGWGEKGRVWRGWLLYLDSRTVEDGPMGLQFEALKRHHWCRIRRLNEGLVSIGPRAQ
jgi:hypothetical protein